MAGGKEVKAGQAQRLPQRFCVRQRREKCGPSCLIIIFLEENIKKRKRAYEQNIPDEYLFNIQETYTSYIKHHNIKTIFIDASNADFLGNEKHLQVVLDALDKDYEVGQHYFTLP